jgi:probable rRNA maturation factor
MARLNKAYRRKEGPTNVLAFSMLEGEVVPHSKVLGDIVISLDTAEREAAQMGIPLFQHVVRLMIHGLLHLVGYDHEEDEEAMTMDNEEERLISLAISNEVEHQEA